VGGGAFVVTQNVGGLRSQGIEVQASWAPTHNFTLSTEFAYLDAYYKNYKNAGCNAVQQIAQPVGCVQDLSGIAPPFAPDFSGTVRASYNHPITSSINFSGDLAFSFSGGYTLAPDNDPIARQGDWRKVDLRLGLSGADDDWSVALIGKNIFNEKVFATANDLVQSPGSYYATIERGRSFAIQARYNWK
jgi:iron complex outermembrane receptor protein